MKAAKPKNCEKKTNGTKYSYYIFSLSTFSEELFTAAAPYAPLYFAIVAITMLAIKYNNEMSAHQTSS